MTHQSKATEGIVLIVSVNAQTMVVRSSHLHIASTPEGCRISRDGEIGFIVVCGNDNKSQRRVPTLPAAYAICQQMMPRRLAIHPPV